MKVCSYGRDFLSLHSFRREISAKCALRVLRAARARFPAGRLSVDPVHGVASWVVDDMVAVRVDGWRSSKFPILH